MKTKWILGAIALGSAVSAGAFFTEAPEPHPFAHATKCEILLTWEPTAPEAVSITTRTHLGALRNCRLTHPIAMATVLIQSLRNSASRVD